MHAVQVRLIGKCIVYFLLVIIELTVFTQRNFVADFLQVKWNFTWKMAILHLLSSPLGVLKAMYDELFFR